MADTFRLEIASPLRLLVDEAVTEATIPGEQGMLGILPGHAPLLSELGTGELRYTLTNGQRHFMAVHGGYLEISGNTARVEIDVARAEAALRRATERVANPLPGIDVARALNAMKRAQARLDAAKAAPSDYRGMPGPGLNQ